MTTYTVLLAAFKDRWDLLATYSIDSDRHKYHVECDFASCDSWFFAPKRDWFQYSFKTQNMNRPCNLIVRIQRNTFAYEKWCRDGWNDYWDVKIYTTNGSESADYEEVVLPDGYSVHGEITSKFFDPKKLAICLEKQLYKLGYYKIDRWDSHCFPPKHAFPGCEMDFWLKVGRKCFAQYMDWKTKYDRYLMPEIFCGIGRVCPICDKIHAPYTTDLVTGKCAPWHADTPPCGICNYYHDEYKIVIDEYCHIAIKEWKEGAVDYHE